MSNPIQFLRTTLGAHWGSQLFSSAFAVFFGAALLKLCWIFGNGSNVAIAQNVLLCLVGSLFGWAVGMFFSPFDKDDASRFEYLGKTVAAFASGYVLSKVEPIISAASKKIAENPANIQWEQVGLFISGFLLSAIVVFVTRSYALKEAVKPAADALAAETKAKS